MGPLALPILGNRWTPRQLGSSLLGWWDASRSDLLTLSGASVVTWRDAVGGYEVTQGTAGARPTYGAASLGGRPALSFDGVDDELTLASVPFPTGAVPCEVWVLADQTALPADTTARLALSWGDGGGSPDRRVGRGVLTGVNRAQAFIGTGTIITVENGSVDYSGRHLVRAQIGAAQTSVDVDGVLGVGAAAVPTTGTTRTRIGAAAGATASGWWQGLISQVLVTKPLSGSQAAQLTAWGKAVGGVL